VERNLHLLTALGEDGSTVPGRLTLQVRHAARRAARDDFAAAGVAETDVIIGMIPGSQWATKRWPAARFAALIERLSAEPGRHCVLFGGAQDRPIAEAIRSLCRTRVIDRVGHTALRDLPAYMACCTVVVSNDTGPMHIAAALGKPIVALFGPTIPAMGFAPYGVRWEEASVWLPCRPCHPHGPHRCPLSHWRCMRDLGVEQVAAGVDRLLSYAGQAREVDV
jgi:heptosyltransferase-2